MGLRFVVRRWGRVEECFVMGPEGLSGTWQRVWAQAGCWRAKLGPQVASGVRRGHVGREATYRIVCKDPV